VAPEPEGSSPHSQQPATSPYPEPVESTPHPPTNLPKVHFYPILPSTPWSFKWSFSYGIPSKTLYTFLPSPMRATCPTHLILLDLMVMFNTSFMSLLGYQPQSASYSRRSHFKSRFCNFPSSLFISLPYCLNLSLYRLHLYPLIIHRSFYYSTLASSKNWCC
jgi:hypothetical protein